jgi:uncharacterized membrane protein
MASVRDQTGSAVVTAHEGELPHDPHRLWDWIRRRTAATWFVLLALPMGVFLVFAVPPFQGQDEPNQFFRAYTISDGSLVSAEHDGRVGGFLPACVDAYVHALVVSSQNPNPYPPGQFIAPPTACANLPVRFVAFENTAYYSPVSYLPHVVGIGIARLLKASVPVVYYAGRLGSLIAYIAMFVLAIRIAPVGKPVFLLLGLWPMALQQAATYSADTVTLGLAVLLTACVLRLWYSTEPQPRLLLLVFLAAVGLGLSKVSYALLTPILLLIPARAFPSRVPALIWKIGMLAVVGFVAVIWLIEVKNVSLAAWFPGQRIDPHAQLSYALHHPFWYVRFMLDGLFGNQSYLIWRSFISIVGFFRNPIKQPDGLPPPWVMVLGYCLILSVYIREFGARAYRWSWRSSVIAAFPLILLVLNVAAVYSAIFIQATPLLAQPGIAGRYFFPLVTLPLLSLAVMGVGQPRAKSVLWMLPFVLAMYAWLGFQIHLAFYT